ncbi:MAG: hypothetical protein VX210_10945 [Myxococcota bacterium]|nr:hypothetical protein [Myxococcota bacterium]
MIRRAAITLGLVTLIGCGHTKDIHPVAAWNSSLESELTHSFENKKFVLGHTFNIGPRLNDFSANLADPRPFDAFVVTDADGYQHSLAAGGKTLPIGTPVQIEGFIPPTTSMWPGTLSAENDPADGQLRVIFKVREGEQKGRFIAVLPVGAQTGVELRGAMNQRFQSETWLKSWFATRSPEVKEAIENKKVISGMSNAEVRVAVGVATNEAERAQAGPQFIARYGDLQVVFAGATVLETKSLRAEAERKRAEEAKRKLEEEERLAKLEAEDKAAAEKARAEAEAEADAKAKAEAEKARATKKKNPQGSDLDDIPVIKVQDSKESEE